MDTQNEKSLYEKLGKKEGIIAITHDILANHLVNPVIKDSFLPYKKGGKYDNLKKHVVEFICAGSGGPEEYTGKDMSTAHKDLNVTEAEYEAATSDIMKGLEKHSKGEEIQNEVRIMLDSVKDQVVGQ